MTMQTNPTLRRLAALGVVAILMAGCDTGGATLPPDSTSAPVGTRTPVATDAAGASSGPDSTFHLGPSLGPDATPTPTSNTGTASAPVVPPSTGVATLYHLQLGTDLDSEGNPVGQGTNFAEGTTAIIGFLGWKFVPAGTELKVRLFQGDRFAFEASHTVVNESNKKGSVGFVFPFVVKAGFPAGAYSVEVDYNGVTDEVVPFTVGTGPGFDAVVGTGSQSGPIPYANPADVLVVTRASVLRKNLGSRTDEVLAAAAKVGDLHDLEADGQTRDTAKDTVAETQRLLKAGNYKYLLIIGNDDTVPYVRVTNPLADSEKSDLADWQLPADWVPSDNFYTDLNGDQYGTPDLPVARIPSSDDADLLLKQLGENTPPDGGGFALMNQERKVQGGLITSAMSQLAQIRMQYVPPTTPDQFASNADASNARYLYVLLHGIGVATNSWAANTVSWSPTNTSSPLDDEWSLSEANQTDGVRVESNPTSHGVVFIGACYGAWTLDTIQEPVHKTSDNDLALHYLKSGTRAYVADTHISYSYRMAPTDIPMGRTGFEYLFWNAVAAGQTPIDAFQTAKVGISKAIDALVAAGDVDTANVNLKTLHYMVYLGRP